MPVRLAPFGVLFLTPDHPSLISARSASILFVANLFHPLDDFSIERFLNGNVRHRGRRRSAVPMLLVRRKPDHIARSDFFDRSAPTLRPSKTRRNDQRLTERMCMPRSACTRLERDACTTHTCRLRSFKQRINPHCPGKPVSWPFSGTLRTNSFDFHAVSLSSQLMTIKM